MGFRWVKGLGVRRSGFRELGFRDLRASGWGFSQGSMDLGFKVHRVKGCKDGAWGGALRLQGLGNSEVSGVRGSVECLNANQTPGLHLRSHTLHGHQTYRIM